MNNNLSIFNSLIVPDEELEATEQLTIEGMHEVTDSNSDNKDAKKPGKVVKYTAKAGKNKNSKVDINWDIKQYRLNRVNHILMQKVDVLEVTFVEKGKGLSEDMETKVHITESWMGFLAFLIGAIYVKYGTHYTEILSGYGVLNQNIQLKKKLPIYLDREAEIVEIYKINGVGVYLEYIPNPELLRISIGKALEALNFTEAQVGVMLYNPAFGTDDNVEIKTIKGESKSKKKKGNNVTNIKLDNTPSGLYTKSLAQLHKKSEQPDKMNIKTVIIDGEPEMVSSNLHALGFILSYIVIFFEDEAVKSIKKNTRVGTVGVVEDNQELFGTGINTMKLPNCNLYAFTNGQISEMLLYLYKVLKSLNIDQSSVEITYEG